MFENELFHYTNVDGLEGILTNQTLHATHFRFLNDKSELTFASHHIVTLFKSEIDQIVMNDDSRFGSIDKIIKAAFVEDEAMTLFKTAFSAIDSLSPIFVTSLCRHISPEIRARGLLSQWRSYGLDGGYCIVFDESKFLQVLAEFADDRKIAAKAWDPVTYLETREAPNLQKFRGIASAYFKNKFNQLCVDGKINLPVESRLPFTLDYHDPGIGELLTPLLETLPFTKHKSFEEEQEFRIVVAAYASHLDPPAGKPPPFLFRKRNQVLVPYIQLFDKGELPINRVIVGPGKLQIERAYGVEQLVASCKLNIEVQMSEIPLV
jgi:Protein of unknown function (DUF2971)